MENFYMLRIGITSLILVVTILSCRKAEQITSESSTFISMNFDELVEGQIFKYALLEAVGYSDEEYFDFNYTNDTLLLEIVNIDINEITVRESISIGSKMHSSTDNYYWGSKDSTYFNTWIIENVSLKTFGTLKSHLFPRTYFPLDIDTSCIVEVIGWKTSFPFVEGDKYLFTTNYSLNGIEFDTVGIYLNNNPLSFDGHGNTIFYSKKHGIIRTSMYSAWTDEGQGWDRIK